MKAVRLILALLLLAGISVAQQGTWTSYISYTSTVNADGSVTVTPTVSVSGNDGGWCDPTICVLATNTLRSC